MADREDQERQANPPRSGGDNPTALLRILQEKDKVIESLKTSSTERDRLNESQIRLLSEDNDHKGQEISALKDQLSDIQSRYMESSSKLGAYRERVEQSTRKFDELKAVLKDYKKNISHTLDHISDMVSNELTNREKHANLLAEHLQENHKKLEEKLALLNKEHQTTMAHLTRKQNEAKSFIREALGNLQEALNRLDLGAADMSVSEMQLDRGVIEDFNNILKESEQAFSELNSRIRETGSIVRKIENINIQLTDTPKLDRFFTELDSSMKGTPPPPAQIQGGPMENGTDELDAFLEEASRMEAGEDGGTPDGGTGGGGGVSGNGAGSPGPGGSGASGTTGGGGASGAIGTGGPADALSDRSLPGGPADTGMPRAGLRQRAADMFPAEGPSMPGAGGPFPGSAQTVSGGAGGSGGGSTGPEGSGTGIGGGAGGTGGYGYPPAGYPGYAPSAYPFGGGPGMGYPGASGGGYPGGTGVGTPQTRGTAGQPAPGGTPAGTMVMEHEDGEATLKPDDDLIMRESPNLAPYNWDMLPSTSPLLRFRRLLNNAKRAEHMENYTKSLAIYEVVKQQRTIQDDALALNILEDQIEAINRLARAQVSNNRKRESVERYYRRERTDDKRHDSDQD